ncbi:uncharacterized protein LOC135426708 [Drosophila montana]|uniref:uncharacterized protein LOC135426708 n=1 Tax=Drosophila montana TaxID=40370 RepID=UPI00313F11D5
MRLHFGTGMLFLILLFEMMSVERVIGSNIVDDTVDIIKLIHEVSSSLLKAWDLIEYLPLGSSNDIPLVNENQRQIMHSIEQVNNKISNLEEKQAEYFTMTIETLRREFHAESELTHKMTYVGDITRSLLQRYRDMIDYDKYKENVNPYTLRNFAEWTVKPGPSSIGYLLEMLHTYIYDETENDATQSLFAKLVSNYESDMEQLCASNRSPQQFAYDMYTKATLIEIKGYIMLEFSWMVLRDFGLGNFTQEMLLMRNKYQHRMLHSQQVLRQVLAHTGRIYWRCDPKPREHVLGKTYDEITRLMQGYVENEINLNTESSCYQSCEDYQDVRVTGCQKNEFCNDQPKCAGRVHSCQFVDSDMDVCQSYGNSSRRYEFIHYDNGRLLNIDEDGTKNLVCSRGSNRVKSWSFHLFWRCHYCFCLCDEPGPQSDRYFSLRDTLSDFHQNKIVTGARFIKDQRIFHLQLQQGELWPGGLINQSSLDWIPLESFDVNHVDIRNGFDYHELTFESRSLDLDEITAKNDSLVVTGARFRVIDKHLNLEVRFSLFNFTTGRLLNPEVNSFWLGNNADKPRQKLLLKNPDKPTKTTVKSVPLSKNNQFMEFISSSMDMDAAQTTVPFIDIQDVVTNPAMPISGLGIYHKGKEGFGGFFAPKIVTFNLLQKLTQPQT